MIDLPTVGALRAVQQYGSVVAAAAALGFTPSAVSQQIKRLERDTGVALLERVGRGVLLTLDGRELVERCARMLGELEEVETHLQQRSGVVAGTFRVAAFATAVRGMLAPMLAEVSTRYPDLRLQLLEHDPWEAVELVASGQADIGIVHSWGDVHLDVPSHVASLTLGTDVGDLLVPHTHPLAVRSRVSPKDLRGLRWIATPNGTICREWLNRLYDGTGELPDIVHRSSEFDNHIALVAAGLGVALVPRLGRATLPPSVVAVAVRNPEPRRMISLLVRHTMAKSPAVGALMTALCS
jgi:DNA-binding transcriptional LysR family regulator